MQRVILSYVVFLTGIAAAGMTAADVLYVSAAGSAIPPYTNLAAAATNIEDAVDASTGGDTVLVDDGLYLLTSPITVTGSVTVTSINGPFETVIDGQGITRCLILSNAGAKVSGFTLRNGRVTGYGGGALIHKGMVDSCIITSNRAYSSYSSSTYALGGGILLYPGAVLRNCLVCYNATFNDETAYANGGGVVLFLGGIVENCTIVHNSTEEEGGGIYFVNGLSEPIGGRAVNSIIYNNESPGIYDNYTYSGSISHTLTNCCIWVPFIPGIPGSGNHTNDPRFVNSTNDFRLRGTSPCIDAATNQPWMALGGDLDGHPRLTGARADQGAFEAGIHPLALTIYPDGVWVTYDMVVDGAYQWMYTSNLMDQLWMPFGPVRTNTASRIMIRDFMPSNPHKTYRMEWVR